jgi:putative SOS response-associated peptidase YedK
MQHGRVVWLSLFAFPGIWQRWKGPLKKDGPNVEIDTYAFMTTEPNALTRAINHERMPVLLSGEDQFETWLSGSPAEAFALAKSFNPALMRIVQSGTFGYLEVDVKPCTDLHGWLRYIAKYRTKSDYSDAIAG